MSATDLLVDAVDVNAVDVNAVGILPHDIQGAIYNADQGMGGEEGEEGEDKAEDEVEVEVEGVEGYTGKHRVAGKRIRVPASGNGLRFGQSRAPASGATGASAASIAEVGEEQAAVSEERVRVGTRSSGLAGVRPRSSSSPVMAAVVVALLSVVLLATLIAGTKLFAARRARMMGVQALAAKDQCYNEQHGADTAAECHHVDGVSADAAATPTPSSAYEQPLSLPLDEGPSEAAGAAASSVCGSTSAASEWL
jgi:hypothetical protein